MNGDGDGTRALSLSLCTTSMVMESGINNMAWCLIFLRKILCIIQSLMVEIGGSFIRDRQVFIKEYKHCIK